MRVAHFGVNWGSQMSVTVEAQRHIGIDAIGYARRSNKTQTPTGLIEVSRFEMFVHLLIEMFLADVIHIYGGVKILPGRLELIPLALWRGRKIVEWMGSEIRMPELERSINHVFAHAWDNGYEYRRDESTVRSWWLQTRYKWAGFRAVVNSWDLRRYCITDYDLVERRAWGSKRRKKHDGVVVIHCPSARVCKGTDYIERAVSEIPGITYRRVTGTHDEILEAMREADVVIDQIVLGDIGLVSIEAMLSGCRVVAWLKPDVAEKHPWVYTGVSLVDAIGRAINGRAKRTNAHNPIDTAEQLRRIYVA